MLLGSKRIDNKISVLWVNIRIQVTSILDKIPGQGHWSEGVFASLVAGPPSPKWGHKGA